MIRRPSDLRPVIDACENYGATKSEANYLCQLFKTIMVSAAMARANEAWFDVSEFDSAKREGGEGFTLHLLRREFMFTEEREGEHFWEGVYTRGEQRVEVWGKLVDWDDKLYAEAASE